MNRAPVVQFAKEQASSQGARFQALNPDEPGTLVQFAKEQASSQGARFQALKARCNKAQGGRAREAGSGTLG